MDQSNILQLALKSQLPLIHVTTDDVINAEEVLAWIAGAQKGTPQWPVNINLPPECAKVEDLKFPPGRKLLYTSAEVKPYVAKLYRHCVEEDTTIVFINTERSKVMLDGGVLFPPKEMVLEWLKDMGIDNPEELLPAFGGMTLKDVGECAKMTMTRDEAITPKGISQTRRGYRKLQGITQVDTDQAYYVTPPQLGGWLKYNTDFFKAPKHPSLTPRGLLFDGPPGTGKTEASKAIAQAFGVPLYRLDLGTMMGKYVGESEGNLNAALAQIDEVEPCVIIFDEVEKVFRGNGSDSSGVSSRMLSQLLWWLQEHKTRVFTVMTTNDIDAIPQELYRPGRIDKTMQFLGIPTKEEAFDFSRGAFDTLLSEMSAEASQEDYVELQKRVNAMYIDGAAVPQVKLTTMVQALVRESLASAPTEAATPDPAQDVPPDDTASMVQPPQGKVVFKLPLAKKA